MKTIGALAIAFILFIGGARALYALHEGGHDDAPAEWNFNVGRNGEVSIGADVKCGKHLLKKGKYMVTHRADGARHVFVLAPVDRKKGFSEPEPVEVDTRFTPGVESVKSSRFFSKKQSDGKYEVVRIQLIGENGDHIITK